MFFQVLSGIDILFMVDQLSCTAERHDQHKIIKPGSENRCAGLWASSRAQIGHHALVESTVHTWLCAPRLLCAPAFHPYAHMPHCAHLPRSIPAMLMHLRPTSGPTRTSCAPVWIPTSCVHLPPLCTHPLLCLPTAPHPPCIPASVPLACHTCGCRDGFQAEEQEGIGIAVLMPNTYERVRRC